MSDTKALAERIVDGILDTVDRAGRFEGRGANRRITLQEIVDLNTGKVTHARDRMIEWVADVIDGKVRV